MQSNTMYLRRRRKLMVSDAGEQRPWSQVASMLKNLESLGFTCEPALIARMRTLSEPALVELYASVSRDLRAMLGADRDFSPMYPGFPEQVMALEESELYLNALIHYASVDVEDPGLPDLDPVTRPALSDVLTLEILRLGDEDDFLAMFRRLIGAKTSISGQDRQDLAWAVETYAERVDVLLPESIPHKENLAFVTSLLLTHTTRADEVLDRYYKTATDVLRLATALSSGDVSLAENSKFRSFTRAERRMLLGLIERTGGSLEEDMWRNRERFVRLGERLHPGEYKNRFPRAAAAFTRMRRKDRPETFASQVEAALASGDADAALATLQARPGELARRLDHLLRLGADLEETLTIWEARASKVSTPVLLQVMTHFEHRQELGPLRAFFPKGNAARVQTVENELEVLPEAATVRIVSVCQQALLERFSALESLGKVYLDPELATYLVPFSQRSASRALRTLVRGSSVALPPGDTVRFFLWWREGEVDGSPSGRVDIDLSSVLYNESWDYVEHISYTNLKSEKYLAAHSGDITSAPEGACEFIDLDIPSIVKFGGRYVVMSVLSYTRQPFTRMPECFAGWMMRQEAGSGEAFEPSTVVDKIDVSADTRICVPVILDLATRRMYWADLALRSTPNWSVNVESNDRGMVHMGRAIVGLKKTTLHDLFRLHALARGEGFVGSPEEADTVFSRSQGVTPFDLEEIMAEFL